MYISRLVIRNFRNSELLDIPLEDGITSIVGENNTGKTNLVHAIRLALDADLPGYVRQLSSSDIHASLTQSEPFQVVVSLEFRGFEDNVLESAFASFYKLADDHARLSYRFRPNASARDAIESGEIDGSKLTLGHYRWEITGGPGPDPVDVDWNEDLGQGVRQRDLADYLVVFLHALRDVSADLRNSRTSPLCRVLRTLDISRDEQDLLVDALKSANTTIASNSTIKGIGTSLDTRLTKTAGEAFDLNLDLGMASPSFSMIERGLRLILGHNLHLDFETGQNGLGVNNVIYVAILLEYFERRARQGGTAGQLLLVEEPEAHLHPQLERVLFDTLRSHGVQVIVTTHSTHITSAGRLNEIAVLTNTRDGSVHGHVPRDNPALTDRDRADIDRYLDATKSTLLFARRVILVEGPAELFLIPRLSKVVKKLDLDRSGIAVVPIHGTHFKPFARLFGPDAIRKRCAIITDRDGEAPESDGGPPRGLDDVENEYVKVFACDNTFEKELALPGLIPSLRRAAEELNATSLLGAINEVPQNPARIAERTLATAVRHSKGRFAQVVSKHIDDSAEIPQYILDAIEWVCG